jgi:hypothetical protein
MVVPKNSRRNRGSRGPLIGYAIRVGNQSFGIDCFGSPHEVLEYFDENRLSFSELLAHQETGISSTEIFKMAPQIQIRGGQYADRALELLEYIDEGNPSAIEKMVHRNRRILAAQPDNAVSVLLAAIWNGDTDTVSVLIRYGAPVDRGSHFSMTPLHWAAALGEDRVADMLLKEGSDGRALSWFFVSPWELALINKNRFTIDVFERNASSGLDLGSFSVERVLTRMAEHHPLRCH